MNFVTRAALAGAASLSCFAVAVVPAAPAAAIPVFDATNYAQNILQAARALEQINHQIQSLQNEATMLQNMARNLTRLDHNALTQMSATMQRINQLMGEAQGIGSDVAALDQGFREMFPQSFEQWLGRDQRVIAARVRLDQVMGAFRHSLGVQAQVAGNVAGDAAIIAGLVGASQQAVGSLQAQQAANQLLALAAQQQLELQAMLAAQFRSEALEQARRVQAEREGREATQRFLGSGTAYAPQ